MKTRVKVMPYLHKLSHNIKKIVFRTMKAVQAVHAHWKRQYWESWQRWWRRCGSYTKIALVCTWEAPTSQSEGLAWIHCTTLRKHLQLSPRLYGCKQEVCLRSSGFTARGPHTNPFQRTKLVCNSCRSLLVRSNRPPLRRSNFSTSNDWHQTIATCWATGSYSYCSCTARIFLKSSDMKR